MFDEHKVGEQDREVGLRDDRGQAEPEPEKNNLNSWEVQIQGNSICIPCSTATTYVHVSMHMSTAIWKDCCPHCISLLKRRKRASYLQTSFSKPLGLQPSLELRKLCSWPKGLVSHIPDSLSHFCICSLFHSRFRNGESWGHLYQRPLCKSHLRTAPRSLWAAGCRPAESDSLIWVPGWEAKALWIEE